MKRALNTLDGKERWTLLPVERQMLLAALNIALDKHYAEVRTPTVESIYWETLREELS
jgi:hypothetical protein